MFLSAIESIVDVDALNTASALVLSPAATAAATFLRRPLRDDRRGSASFENRDRSGGEQDELAIAHHVGGAPARERYRLAGDHAGIGAARRRIVGLAQRRVRRVDVRR